MSRNNTLPKPYKNQVYDLSLVHNFLFSFNYWIPFLSITGTPILDVYQNVHSKVWIFPLLNYFGGHSVLICLTTDTSVLAMFFLGYKIWVDILSCIVYYLNMMASSDSTLVGHLLTS